MKNKYLKILMLLLLVFSSLMASDYIPGEIQSVPVLIKGGNLYTISQGILENTDMLVENGRITKIEKGIAISSRFHVIFADGKNVYPGLIAPNSSIGLVEIGAVKATQDRHEIGMNNADVRAHLAYNPDSEIIPSVRSNGITTALIVPSGRLIMGRSSLLNLDGWTFEDAMEKAEVGLHISWPRFNISNAWWMEKSISEQKKDNEENFQNMVQIFKDARAYFLAKKSNPDLKNDLRWEAMMPLFTGELPIFAHAEDYRQIESAIDFASEYNFKLIIVGGRDAWKIADRLVENDIPVIFRKTQSNPGREDENYDINYANPKKLYDSGVKFCLSYGSASSTRNLPFQAAQAVAFGLPHDIALRSLTLSTAEILGVEDDLGSLEIGKKATIVISDGDILDHISHRISHVFIEGKEVDLDNKHKELYRKYKEKTIQ